LISISVIAARWAARWRLTSATTGIAMMLVATLLFTVMDSIGKSLTATYPVQQVGRSASAISGSTTCRMPGC
jgi:hypothetical protein